MKSSSAILAICVCAFSATAQESNNMHKMYIEIGINTGSYSGAWMGGAHGAAGIFFKSFGKPSAIDVRAKEMYISSPEREVGAITLTYRLFLSKGFYLGGGFAHNHEMAMNNYVDDPMGATMGNSKNLIHRTGIVAETGYDFKSFIKRGWLGIYPVTNLSITYLAFDREPNPLITLSAGFRFGVIRKSGQ
jgi:hypothetical protein